MNFNSCASSNPHLICLISHRRIAMLANLDAVSATGLSEEEEEQLSNQMEWDVSAEETIELVA